MTNKDNKMVNVTSAQFEINNLTDYDYLRRRYTRTNPYCNTLGKIYDFNTLDLIDCGCKKWHCAKCRPKLMYRLYFEILKNVYAFNLDKHFVITFSGKEMRDKISWSDSYKFMNKAWHKFLQVIEYHYGKISYIVLPRAQKNGYCHYHVILNKYIPWKFLNEKRLKYGLGFVSIQKNKEVAEYLKTDFFKNHEWIIPLNIRHYRCSRDIILNNYKIDKNNIIYFDKDKTLKEISNHINEYTIYSFDIEDYLIEKQLPNFYGYIETNSEKIKQQIIEEMINN